MGDPMRQEYRELSQDEKDLLKAVKSEAEDLHNKIASIGASRELSLALTNLEQAVMWATKHITK